MEVSNPLLWLAWASFGTFLLWLAWKRYLPAVLAVPPAPVVMERAPAAWLFCEDGAALDRRAEWFELRPGGRTVVGGKPRAATAEALFIYLTAEDVRAEHAAVVFNPQAARYELEALD